MTTVRVKVPGRDVLVGTMVRALAQQINGIGGGARTVKGATTQFMREHGFYDLRCVSDEKADEFKLALEKYLGSFVEIEDEKG